MTARIRYFDIAKGIAMICVVLGHSVLMVVPMSEAARLIYVFCFSFHMPLFFVLSGYFMHPDHPFAWRKESRELLLTYVLTAAAVVALHALLALALRHDAAHVTGTWFVAALYGSGADTSNALIPMSRSIGAIWFLLALFWAHLLVHIAYRLPATPLWIISFFAFGYFSSRYIWLPLSVQAGLTSALFVYLGCLAKRFDVMDLLCRRPYLWIVAAIPWGVAMWKFSSFGLATNAFGDTPALSIIGSVGGTACIVGISIAIDRWAASIGKALAFIGRYTLAIFCAHLLENDVLPWVTIMGKTQPIVGYQLEPFFIFAVKCVLIAVIAVALYYVPAINSVFFPTLRKNKKTATLNEQTT
ncbi:acyltransferase family protein [Bifidobacterium sp. ESL0769]|uniref:acyltransferase family protein n=1 Tax=Bifidobacterium sp. ESL0769 TaxID=2983229 RepID=UPI0023F70609|nr:acyltransferase family protein [Bifidobacterium sp. ESL0769]WEV66992.1 acyltransferase family protein [Bifidobacterium sp. ESL0769]